MSWQEIIGHDEIQDRFRRMVAAGRLASTFLFVGSGGIGKRTFALELAKSLLCEVNPEPALNACGHCPACQQVMAGSHPDLEFIAKPTDKSFIPLELFIGDQEHRMREGLCHRIGLKPYCGGRKIAIIDDADYLNQEGANCLLKTLEEPPPKSVIILIGTSEQRQLPTIRSRCQIIRFQPLTMAQIEQLLRQTGIAESEQDLGELAALSEGSLDQARQFVDPAVREFRARWWEFLGQRDGSASAFAKELTPFIDAAGKEAPLRRARLKQVAQMAVNYYRTTLSAKHGHDVAPMDGRLQRVVSTATAAAEVSSDVLSDCLDRCLELEGQVDANANQATLIDSWLDDLCQLRLG